MQLRRAKERNIRLQQSDIREVTSGMNPAQKRCWNAYSIRKKQRLFGQARRAAKRKAALQNENYAEPMEPSIRIWQEEMPEHPNAPVRQETILEEQSWGRERSEYRTAAFKKSTQAGLRQKAPEPDSRPPNRIEKQRDRKSESTIRELLGLIDRDIRRTEGIKQDIRSEQIQMAEAEYETAKTVAATSLIPLRFRYERIEAPEALDETRPDIGNMGETEELSASGEASETGEKDTGPETETGSGSGSETEDASELESEPGTEDKSEMRESESETEASTENESEPDTEASTEPESEPETGATPELESESESESETESDETKDTEKDFSGSNSYYWDDSWYIRPDFRFTQVEKQYALMLQGGPVYEYEAETSKTVGTTTSGTTVYVLVDNENGWVYIESGDVRGFVKKDRLLSGSAARTLALDQNITQTATTCVEPEDNRSLYYTLRSTQEAVSANQIGTAIASYAASFAGKLPYIWGGTSLSTGADCSGFTQAVYQRFGISIPRLAEEQGISGEPVASLALARPGDIIYYKSHVGIYLGNGKVAQCSGGRSNTAANPGRGVTICAADYRPITSIRRYLINTESGYGGGNYRIDPTNYTTSELELIYAIVAQEDNSSYEGALAVISSAMNRTESARWGRLGGNALSQLTAPGQYCYSIHTPYSTHPPLIPHSIG